MKTITKFLSGALLASTLIVGYGQTAFCKYQSTETVQTTDANGNITVTQTTNVDGKETTTTYKALTKPFSFENDTNATLNKLELKTNFDKDWQTVFDEEDALEPDYIRTISKCSFDERVKTMDFRLTDNYGNTVTIEGLDVSTIKDKKEVNFVFEEDDDSISVSLLK